MIIFTSGAPGAGKSELLHRILPKLKQKPILLDPKEYLPKNYEALFEQEKTEINIASWEVCVETLATLIRQDNQKQIIVFDSAASKSQYIIPFFCQAKQKGHEVVYIYVEADKTNLKLRTKNKYLGDEITNQYFNNLETTMPILSNSATLSFSIKNNKDKNFLELHAAEIASALNKRI